LFTRDKFQLLKKEEKKKGVVSKEETLERVITTGADSF